MMQSVKWITEWFGNQKLYIVGVVFLSSMVVISSTSLMGLSGYIIAFCALHPSIADIAVPVVGVRFFGLARGIIRYYERLFSHHTTFKILGDLRIRLFKSILQKPMSHIINMDKSDAFVKVIDDVEKLQEFYLRTINPFLVSILIGITGIIVFLPFGWVLSFVFGIGYFMTIIPLPIIAYRLTRGKLREQIEVTSDIKRNTIELLSVLSELIGNGVEKTWSNKLYKKWKQFTQLELLLATYKNLIKHVFHAISQLTMLGILYYGSIYVMNNGFDPILLPGMIYGCIAFFEGSNGVSLLFQNLEQSKALIDRMTLFEKNDNHQADNQAEYANDFKPIKLVVNQLSVGYYPYEALAIQDIDLCLVQGKKIALLGRSGSGKSTLTYALTGWLKPKNGQVWLIDAEGKAMLPHEKFFNVVNQKTHLFNTTIFKNICLGEEKGNKVTVEESLFISGLEGDIGSLEQGIQTQVGDGDTVLSGGQRSRIAIARSMLRDAPFIILDEVTAHLDYALEEKVIDRIISKNKDKGLLVITHRLNRMEIYDEIIVLEEGKIIERGNHITLMDKKGVYYTMNDFLSKDA